MIIVICYWLSFNPVAKYNNAPTTYKYKYSYRYSIWGHLFWNCPIWQWLTCSLQEKASCSVRLIVTKQNGETSSVARSSSSPQFYRHHDRMMMTTGVRWGRHLKGIPSSSPTSLCLSLSNGRLTMRAISARGNREAGVFLVLVGSGRVPLLDARSVTDM